MTCHHSADGTIHVCRPDITMFCGVNECPTCERPRRMLGEFAEWYGTTWTCAGCGDRWSDEGEMAERPFEPGWRKRNVERARSRLASIGVPA